MILLLLTLTMTGPEVREITPPGGGSIWFWSQDQTVAFGEQQVAGGKRAFVSTEIGVWFLDELVTLPPLCGMGYMMESPQAYRVVVHRNETLADYSVATHSYLVTLPRDLQQWFSPADFDRDGDVDQTDFGLLQRTLGTPEQTMTVAEWMRYKTGAK